MRNTKDTANDPTNKVNMVKENSPRRRKETVNSSSSMQVNQEPSIPTTKTTHDLEPARKITQTNQRTLMRRQCPPSKHRLNCNHLLKWGFSEKPGTSTKNLPTTTKEYSYYRECETNRKVVETNVTNTIDSTKPQGKPKFQTLTKSSPPDIKHVRVRTARLLPTKNTNNQNSPSILQHMYTTKT